MEDLFDIRVVHLDGGVQVELVGELDILAGPFLKEQLRSLAYRYDADQIRIDCGRCTFIDMSTVGQLVHLSNRVAGPGLPALVAPSPMLLRMLELTGAIDRFVVTIDDTELSRSTPPTPVH